MSIDDQIIAQLRKTQLSLLRFIDIAASRAEADAALGNVQANAVEAARKAAEAYSLVSYEPAKRSSN